MNWQQRYHWDVEEKQKEPYSKTKLLNKGKEKGVISKQKNQKTMSGLEGNQASIQMNEWRITSN